MAKKTKKLKKQAKSDKPAVHKNLEGFDIKINPFGEVVASVKIEELNKFLDENVDDLKLKHLKDEEEWGASHCFSMI